MGEYLGVLLRALSRRKASAAAIADRRATVADAAR